MKADDNTYGGAQ